MLVCDRCGETIRKSDNKTESLCIFGTAGSYIWHEVDLCKKCQKELEGYTNKAQSYFMVEKDNPSKIFDNVKYYKR